MDSPELARGDRSAMHFGPEASEFARRLLEGRDVHLTLVRDRTRGKYGRLLAYVFVDEVNVNLELVRLGWTPFYTKYGRGRFAAQFEAAEVAARAAGLGIW